MMSNDNFQHKNKMKINSNKENSMSPDTPVRILHIFGCMQRGGAEMRTLDLMRRVDRDIFKMDFCSLKGLPGELDDDIRELGGEVHYCKLRSLTFNQRFRKLLRQGHYDVVHSHVHYFSGYILRLASQCGVQRRIAHFRNTTDVQSKSFKRRVQTALMRSLINKYATHILAVGEGAMQVAWREDWQKDSRCAVIPNGLDTTPFEQEVDKTALKKRLKLPIDAPVVIHVGRMAKQKNHIRLAQILALLLSQDPLIHVLLAGKEDATIKQQMLKILKSSDVEGRVHFLGVRDDVPQLLMISDLMLFPSLWEGLPGAVLEACAAGTPVLASDIPGVVELKDYFKSIYTISLEFSDDTWLEKCISILTKKILLKEKSKLLKYFCETPYYIENNVDVYSSVWN
jgi:glycosyltransferase involved in cell wall biosynthesis